MEYNKSIPLPSKLTPPWSGPFQVIKHIKNDVHCKDIITGRSDLIFDVSTLKPFIGTADQAFKIAMIDNNQFVIDTIISYRGDPDKRTYMEFLVQFADGAQIWLPYTIDLSTTIQFSDFIHKLPALFPLRYPAAMASKEKSRINTQKITEVAPGDMVYIDIRCYGYQWFKSLQLPNADTIIYLLTYKYTRWTNTTKTKISAVCELLDEYFKSLDHMFVYQYGSMKTDSKQLSPSTHFIITKEFVCQHPEIIQEDRRKRLIQAYSKYS